MFRKIALVAAVGCCCFAAIASAGETSAEGLSWTPGGGCAAQPAMTRAVLDAAVLTAGGGIGESSTASCCYSDPCPGWGGYMVSCCAQGCSAWNDRVWCSHTGFIYCPDPCADNGICNSSCSYDPDCQSSCSCPQGSACTDDSDCDCDLGYGVCDKEPWEFLGSCACYF
jgi:hypothetical protein